MRKQDPTEAATSPTSAPAPPRRRGRPPVTPGEIKRYPLSLYVTKALKDQLVLASKTSGRPLTQEIEARLQRTLDEDRGKSELDLQLDAVTAQVREAMLVVVGYHGRPGDTFEVSPELVVRPASKPKSKSRRK